LTHLAYAPEIAQAMLRRQQAEAVIAAPRKLFRAVSMVDMALKELADKHWSCSTTSAKPPWSAISWLSFAVSRSAPVINTARCTTDWQG